MHRVLKYVDTLQVKELAPLSIGVHLVSFILGVCIGIVFFYKSGFEDVFLARSLPQSGSLEIRLSAGSLHPCSQLLSSEHLSYAAKCFPGKVRFFTRQKRGDMRFARAGANTIHTGKACRSFWIIVGKHCSLP